VAKVAAEEPELAVPTRFEGAHVEQAGGAAVAHLRVETRVAFEHQAAAADQRGAGTGNLRAGRGDDGGASAAAHVAAAPVQVLAYHQRTGAGQQASRKLQRVDAVAVRVVEVDGAAGHRQAGDIPIPGRGDGAGPYLDMALRSEEHTSELQSRENLVCR